MFVLLKNLKVLMLYYTEIEPNSDNLFLQISNREEKSGVRFRFSGYNVVSLDGLWRTVSVDNPKLSVLLGVGEIKSAKEPPTV